MQLNVCTDEVQDQLSAFAHNSSYSPRDSTKAHLALMSACPRHGEFKRKHERSQLFKQKYIYTPGVFDLEMKGGCFCMYGVSGLERIRKLGVMSCQVGVGYGWG